jgi:hypothetical protein
VGSGKRTNKDAQLTRVQNGQYETGVFEAESSESRITDEEGLKKP